MKKNNALTKFIVVYFSEVCWVIIDNIQFTAVVNGLRIDDKDVRRKIEDELLDFTFSIYNPPRLPAGMPQIPYSMTGQTKAGHSRLQILEQNFQLFTSFDENFNNDRQKCFDYAYGKIDAIVKLIKGLSVKNLYFGIALQYIIENEPKAIDLINQGSVKILNNSESFFNFSKNFSVVYKDRYYINFGLSTLSHRNSSDKLIGITVDINNRYGIEIKNELEKDEDIAVIKKMQSDISEDFLYKLLRKGELDFHE